MTTDDIASARPAADSDLSCVLELARLAMDELGDQRGGELLLFRDLANIAEAGRYLTGLEEDRYLLVVGLLDGAVVGYALAAVSATAGHQLCMIEELFVHVEARGIGVGARLLTLIREWAERAGCRTIESHVLPGNRAAKNFFERVGMVTRKMQVSTNL